MGTLTAKLDDMGKPAWIALMIVSFWMFWPIGLAVLAYLIGSGRMACWKNERWERKFQAKMDGLGLDHVANTPEQFAAFGRSELAKWQKVVKDGNVKPE